jgi:hypothetical protein
MLMAAQPASARTLVTADGPAGVPTYELLGKAFSIEVPDCRHMVPHITEEFDAELGKNVFIFHLHVNEDDDRCGATDRQRTEIRGGKLAAVVASNGETVHYRWKFKLPLGFQTSANFTHIFQVKSDAGSPVMTLTPRSSNLSIDGVVGTRGTVPLAPFLGTWVVVNLTVVYGPAGHIDMVIRRIAGGQVMLSHSGDADTWQGSDSGHDPKFGIYRSLANPAALRDEQVRFADFCVSKVSAAECDDDPQAPPDAGTPAPDAAAPPADAAVVVPPPRDAAVVIPPPRDAAVVIPPPRDAAVVIPPPPDAAVVIPPPPDAAVVIPPSPDAAVAPPSPDAAFNPEPSDAAVPPMAKLDAASPGSRPADAGAVTRPRGSDAAYATAPDASSTSGESDGGVTRPFGEEPPGSRTRRQGERAGCQLAPGAAQSVSWSGPILLVAAWLAFRRRRSSPPAR